jgi:hypothetical protein
VSHLAPTALDTAASPAVYCLIHKLAPANSCRNPYPHHAPLTSDTLGLRAAPFKSHSKPTASGFLQVAVSEAPSKRFNQTNGRKWALQIQH